MKIENIIYETTRETYSIEDKLSIATIFLFCEKMDSKLFAELLYTESHENFIYKLSERYSSYNVDFSVKLQDKNVKNSFYKTLEKVKQKFDEDKYYKALYEEDEFVLVIYEMVSFDFDFIKMQEFNENIAYVQTKLF